ncbi:MAG TPA: hypothetical protein VHW00_02880 [Thermoanaerobaculia bacterium]|nr:hypothetical protein [Thermoanaerobaculia bacterium]
MIVPLLLGAETPKKATAQIDNNIYCGTGSCSNTYCNVMELWQSCSETDDPSSLYWEQCSNTAAYYRLDSNCCVDSITCCTYVDSRGNRRNRPDDNGTTVQCWKPVP